MTRKALKELGRSGVNLSSLFVRAGLNPATMRSKVAKDIVTERDAEALRGALKTMISEMTDVL